MLEAQGFRAPDVSETIIGPPYKYIALKYEGYIIVLFVEAAFVNNVNNYFPSITQVTI